MANGGNGGLNTLEYVQKLEQAGMPREQAEAQATVFYDIVSANLASKTDLDTSTLTLKHDIELVKKDIKALDVKIETVRSDLKKDVETIRSDVKKDIKQLELKIETVRQDIVNVGKDLKASQGTQTIQIIGAIAALIAIFRFLPEILN